MSLDAYEPFVSIGIALAAGLLIGLEREQSSEAEQQSGLFLGGVRTYPLFALLGALSVLVGYELTVWLPLLAFAGVLAFVAISYADDVRRERDRGLTTEVSILVTFLLGMLATSRGVVEPVSDRVLVVSSLAVVVTFLLSSKIRMQALIAQVSRDDLFATLKFLIVAVLILPLLPNVAMGPLEAINPFNVGLMVVLIASISFVGYVSTRLLGEGRGLTVTAMLGGLVSSTAVTLSFAGRVRSDSSLAPMAAVAIVLASTIMLARMLVEVAIVHLPLLGLLSLPVLAMTAAGVIANLVLYRRAKRPEAEPSAVTLSNPFELSTAVRFGLLYAAVLLVSKAAQRYAGAAGMYAAAALAGTTDVDAITLSTASMAAEGLDTKVAITTILIGAVSNTIVKAGMAASLGGWVLGKPVVIAYVAMLLAAVGTMVGLWVAL